MLINIVDIFTGIGIPKPHLRRCRLAASVFLFRNYILFSK